MPARTAARCAAGTGAGSSMGAVGGAGRPKVVGDPDPAQVVIEAVDGRVASVTGRRDSGIRAPAART
jgi:hypothetical protein